MYKWNQIRYYHGKSIVQQEEGSFHQQIGLKYKEETRENTTFVAHLLMVLKHEQFGK